MISRVYTTSTQDLELKDVKSFIESRVGNKELVHSYNIDIKVTVYHRPSSLLPLLTTTEMETISSMDFSVYEDVIQLNNSVFTLNKRDLHQRILRMYASTVKNPSDIVNRLLYMLSLPKYNLLKSVILDDLDDFLMANMSCLPDAYTRQLSFPPPPPQYTPMPIRIPLVPLQIPHPHASTSTSTPIPRASNTTNKHIPAPRPSKEIHLRNYGYIMKSPASMRRRCIDQAIEGEGVHNVLARITFLKNQTRNPVFVEDYDYITENYFNEEEED
jgi:hypothetical protein